MHDTAAAFLIFNVVTFGFSNIVNYIITLTSYVMYVYSTVVFGLAQLLFAVIVLYNQTTTCSPEESQARIS